jgi:lipoyl(octanoyl) transferase
MSLIPYREAWEYQKDLFQESISSKITNLELPYCEQVPDYNYLLFCEHPHVYTLGKSGNTSNLLVNQEELMKKGIEFFHIERGGDITYHGPGQIVVYPIFDLEKFGLGLKKYIFLLEQIVIDVLGDIHIDAERLDGATGVWLDSKDPSKARKICAIGVKVSRYVTMHGFALNVNTDLSYYDYMNPCGFTDKGVTSIQKEAGHPIEMDKIKKMLLKRFSEAFHTEIITNI